MNKTLITPQIIKNIFNQKGYKFYENDSKNFNLNIVGIRTNDMTPNTFNDYICLLWKFNGTWTVNIYDATTDPGLYYLLKPMNVNGTAIMKPGQYNGVYIVGLHKGYTALEQVKPMDYYRDNDHDSEFDINDSNTYTENGKTNIHHASNTGKSTIISNWSAGCQVIADIKDWKQFISICQLSKAMFGNSFSYTLITEKDFYTLNDNDVLDNVTTIPTPTVPITINTVPTPTIPITINTTPTPTPTKYNLIQRLFKGIFKK